MASRAKGLSMKMDARRWTLLACTCALMACGGGGGDSSSGPGESPPVAAGPDDPTMTIGRSNLSSTAGASTAAEFVLSTAAYSLNLAQLAVDVTHRMSIPGTAGSVSFLCMGNGRATVTRTDLDGDGHVGAGDEIDVSFERCAMPVIQRSLQGKLRVAVTDSASSISGSRLRLSVSIDGSLGLDLEDSFAFGESWPHTALRGALQVDWDADAVSSRTRVRSAASENLIFDIRLPLPTARVSVRRLDLTKDIRYDEARISTTMAYIFDAGSAGRLVVSTPEPLTGLPGQRFTQGRVLVRAGFGATLELSENLTPFGPDGSYQLRAAGGQLVEEGPIYLPPAAASLTWDGRRTVAYRYTPGPQVPYIDFDGPRPPHGFAASELQVLLERHPDFVRGAHRVDAVFERPVLPDPPAMSGNALYRLRFGSPLAASQAALRWRFFDVNEDSPVVPSWSVPAEATRFGSVYLFRPLGPLRYGRTYHLQFSHDGVDWSASNSFALADGGAIALTGGAGGVTTPPSLTLSIPFDFYAVPSPNHPATVSATAATDGASIASWRWEQLDGDPLILASPDAPSTAVAYAPGAPRPYGRSTLQLTVTDTLGRSQPIRVLVKAGDTALSGVLYLSRFRSFVYDEKVRLSGGGGEVIAAGEGIQPGSWFLRVFDLFDPFWGQVLRMPDGGALAVGKYLDARPLPAPAGLAGVSCVDFSCAPGTTGWVEVLEVEQAPDGRILRLAVDYEQTSGENYHHGSYRLNSAIPVRP